MTNPKPKKTVPSVYFKDVHISGAQVGIKAEGPINIIAENLTFENVGQPFDIAGGHAEISGTRIKSRPTSGKNKSQVGWTRPHGPPLPAFCPECKSVFPSRNYNFGSSYFYSRDNEETCRICDHEHAKLSDGLFDLSREAVRVLNAPDMTHAMLEAIREVALQVVSNSIQPEEAVEKFGAISPFFGDIARRGLKWGWAGLKMLALLAAVVVVPIAHRQMQISQEQLELIKEQVEVQEDKEDREDSERASDAMLEKVLEALWLSLKQAEIEGNPKDVEDTGTGEATAKSSPVELGHDDGPKNSESSGDSDH